MNDVTTIPRKSPSRSDDLERRVRNRSYLLAAVIVLAALVALVAWLVTSLGDDNPADAVAGPVAAAPVEPVVVNVSGLKTLASAVGQPIYWAGPRNGFLYELRRTEDGNTYIRYLPSGVDAGAGGADYLTIATYPFLDALEALEKVAGGRGIKVEGGGLALVAAEHPTSVHLAYPGVDYQVEVYDPSPARALAVARSGNVRPAG